MSAYDKTKANLSKQSAAAAALIEEIGRDDDDLTRDMVEGETDLFESIQAALDEIGECEIMVAGLKDHIAKLKTRQDRAEGRAAALKGAIDQAMAMAEITSHKFTTATVSRKDTPVKLIVTDEAAIPSRFWEPQPPKLDRKLLLDALKAGDDIEGASKSNGGSTIQIRRV